VNLEFRIGFTLAELVDGFTELVMTVGYSELIVDQYATSFVLSYAIFRSSPAGQGYGE
jgi:hypothetical protein